MGGGRNHQISQIPEWFTTVSIALPQPPSPPLPWRCPRNHAVSRVPQRPCFRSEGGCFKVKNRHPHPVRKHQHSPRNTDVSMMPALFHSVHVMFSLTSPWIRSITTAQEILRNLYSGGRAPSFPRGQCYLAPGRGWGDLPDAPPMSLFLWPWFEGPGLRALV